MSTSSSKGKEKKPKGVAVASRYKRSAETFSSQSSHSKDSTKGYTKDDISMVRSHNQTKLSKKFTSTPALHRSGALPVINQSAIKNASSLLSVPNGNPVVSCGSSTASTSKKPTSISKKKDQTAQSSCEQEWNIVYAQYLQAKLLESIALKSLEKRFKCALAKIHQVWHLLLTLLDTHKTVERRLNYITLIAVLDDHTRKQKEMLSSTIDVIPSLEKQYSSIAEAITAVNNKLEVENIVLPAEEFQNEMVTLIGSINDLMNEIVHKLPHCEKLISVRSQTESVVEQTNILLTEVDIARELLQEARDLVLSETSLKLQCT